MYAKYVISKLRKVNSKIPNDKEPSNYKHCEGVCLCSHFSNTLNFISDLSNCKINDSIKSDLSILHTKFFISSFTKSPPKRPPKI